MSERNELGQFAPVAVVEAPAPTPVDAPADDSALRAAFNEMLASEADRDGKPVQQLSTPQAAEPVEKSKETTVQDEPVRAASKVSEGALEQAVKALRLDEWTSEDFEGLTPERIVAHGAAAAKRQAAISKRFEESAIELKAAREAASNKPVERTATDEPPKRQPQDWKTLVKPLAQKLNMLEDDEPALAEWAEAITTPVRAELEQAKNMLGQMGEMVFDLHAQAARGRLPERVRSLVDDATFVEKVLPKAKAWLSAGVYKSLDEALSDAALISVSPALHEQHASASALKTAARENGSMSSADRRTPQKPKSRDDILRAAFDATDRGGSEDEIRAAINGL